MESIEVKSGNVQYTEKHIESKYVYNTSDVSRDANGRYIVVPRETQYRIRTERQVRVDMVFYRSMFVAFNHPYT